MQLYPTIGQHFLFSFNLKARLYKKKTFFLRNNKRFRKSCLSLFFCYLFIIFVIFRLFSLEKIWSVCRRGRSTGIPGLPVGGIPVFFVSRQACMHTDYSGQRYPLFFAGGKACGHTEYSGRFCRKTISRLSSEAACILCFLPCFRQQAGREQRAARQPPLPCYLYFLLSF